MKPVSMSFRHLGQFGCMLAGCARGDSRYAQASNGDPSIKQAGDDLDHQVQDQFTCTFEQFTPKSASGIVIHCSAFQFVRPIPDSRT
jgi:hypothetical protein